MKFIHEDKYTISYDENNNAIVTHISSKMIFVGCGSNDRSKNLKVARDTMEKIIGRDIGIEIEKKKNWEKNKAKLTIASNRISLKINENMPENLKNKIECFVSYIVDDIKTKFLNTLRGEILFNIDGKFKITLYNHNKTIKFTYFKRNDERNL